MAGDMEQQHKAELERLLAMDEEGRRVHAAAKVV